MPTYEYRCNACGREFEYQQRMSDDDLVKCEACNEDKLEKLISRTAFQLKGGGWYKDLYSSTKPAEAAKDASTPATAEKSPESSAEKSADKPAEKAATVDKPAAKSDGGGSSSTTTTTTTAAPAASTSTTTKPSAS